MIEYQYQVLEVNKQAGAMLVRYTADNYPTYTIGTRMPYVGEQLIDVIEQYAPIAQWRDSVLQVADVEVGVSGTVTPQQPETTGTAEDFALVTPDQQLLAQAELQKQAIKEIVIEVLNEQSNTVPTAN